MLRKSLLAAAMVLATGAGAQAQTILDGANVDEIVKIAATYGAAELGQQSNGDPRITGNINGITYQVFFLNCAENASCEDLNFYAGFLDNKQTLDVINAWNRDKRFGKAYLDTDQDAVIEFDLNLEHGVTAENLDAAFRLWSLILDQYTTYIGYE